MRVVAIFIALILTSFSSQDCSTLKNGIFYFYPPDSSEPFQIIRKDSVQEEINMKTQDTSFWKIKWSNDCFANLHLIRITKKMEDDEKAFLFGHTTVMQVLSISDKYYVFKAGLDSLNSLFTVVDTVWFNKKSGGL
jgi:hypothetical protein